MDQNRFRIGTIFIAITNTQDSVQRILHAIQNKCKGYICISNMRTVTIAYTNLVYQKVMNESLFNTPDGTPLVWCGRMWGLKQANRACGPHIFRAMLKDKESGLRHFFLGDTDDTLKALTEKCIKEYGTTVAGCYSPPFKPLEEYDLKGIGEMINESGANIVWTSLRAPKQDNLNAMLLPYLNDGIVLVGVGAAFRFELGEYKAPEGLIQKFGLAGTRVKREGTRTSYRIKWYCKHSYYLTCFLLSILFKRLTGTKYYE